LIKTDRKASESDSAITTEQAVDEIIQASDHRVEKFIFPFKPWIAVQMRNVFPKTIGKMVKKGSKL
jgi:hypothetical protein